MKYIINLIFYLWKDDLVFDAVVISEYAERIELQYPEFICIQSLKGRILLHDNRHLIEAESRFIYASKKASKNHVPDELQALLRVEVYKFCEKVRKDMELANELQGKEYKNTKWHILENLYQNIKVCEKKKNWSEMIKLCNEMIVNVLNGRKIELLMPREQIDMYRVYSLLGKAYYEKSIYNLAIACYKMVIEIFETSLNYDEELSLIGLKVFADISKINMPEKKCYIELINCYSACGDDKAIKECQKQLKETVWL